MVITPHSLCQWMQPPIASVVDRVTGIIPLVAEVEIERSDPQVFVCAADVADITSYGLPHPVVSRGSGAGLSLEAAWGAAIGEGIERYALSLIHPEDLIFGSYRQLRQQGYTPIAPQNWALFHPNQYSQIRFAPFQEETPVAWVSAENLSQRQDTLIPACMVYIPYTPHFINQGEQEVAIAISTGAACARTRGESLLKGICELVERDAFMIFWRNQLSCPRVQIDAQSSLYSLFQEIFARRGLQYTLVYITLDIPIPCFCGILLDTRTDSPGILVGGAAHPDPEQAALKTLLELVQGLKWKDYMVKDQPIAVEPGFGNIRSFEDRARFYALNDLRQAFRFVWDHSQELPLSAIPSLDTDNSPPNLQHYLSLLAEQNLEVVALDLTPVDAEACGLYVTKVLIPGCETMEGDHRIPFLGGNRWREVPYRLGWRDTPSDLKSLNPYPHPYP
jgi:ribosomal protein S12 methylthiotransferase accessory factor